MTTACLVLLRRVDHGLGVGDVAVGDHALEFLARHRQDEGLEPVAISSRSYSFLGAVGGAHDALVAIDLDHLLAQVQPDAVLSYQLSGLSTIWSMVCSPASTGLSRMRL